MPAGDALHPVIVRLRRTVVLGPDLALVLGGLLIVCGLLVRCLARRRPQPMLLGEETVVGVRRLRRRLVVKRCADGPQRLEVVGPTGVRQEQVQRDVTWTGARRCYLDRCNAMLPGQVQGDVTWTSARWCYLGRCKVMLPGQVQGDVTWTGAR